MAKRSERQTDAEPKLFSGGSRHVEWHSYSLGEKRPILRFLRLALLVAGVALAIASVYNFTLLIWKSNAIDEPLETQPITPDADDSSSVLLLMSYEESHVSLPYERQGVLDVLTHLGISCDVEYLQTKAYPLGSETSDAILAALESKLDVHGRYDVVIVADDDALNLVEARRNDLFHGAPVVFFGINDHEHAMRVASEGWATGVIEQNCYPETLELIRTLCPKISNVVLLTDDTTTGIGDRAQFELLEGDYPELSFEVLNAGEMSFQQMRSRLLELDSNSVVLHLDTFVDKLGNTMTIDEAAHFFSPGCPVPIFRGNMGGVAHGFCLSAYSDFEEAGATAATMAASILEGEAPSDIPIDTDASLGVTADARVMEQFGLEESRLPEETIVLNSDEDMRERLIGPIALPLGLLVASLLSFLLYAFLGYRTSLADAQQLMRTRDILDFELSHDHLTSLPNRYALEARLAGDDGVPTRSAIEIDIDDFADINDTYGHEAGDEVIREFARRLDRIPSALLARTGGDEFVLLFDHPLTPDSSELRLCTKALSAPVSWKDAALNAGASFGVVCDVAPDEVGDVARRADLAIRSAKAQSGKRTVVFYSDAMDDKCARNTQIVSSLRHALDHDGVEMAYQPQVDAVSREIYGFEALARLTDGSSGPGEFIPIAEMSGMIVEFGRTVIRLVVEQQSAWLAQGLPPRVVSINYSAGQLKDELFCDYLQALLDEHHVPASLIKIEVTESMMMDDVEAADRLIERLQKMGVSLALDDFGTGYSSFDRLIYDAIDFVKFDKTFTDAFLTPENEAVVYNMTRLVHELGKRVVIEGVERREQVEICIRLGCDYIQGYYFSQPLPAADVPDWRPRN
jgi:diguanylate cyclase (GGDEF)-like protein